MLQDPFLFAGTIADNIRFARPEATDEDVADVARAIGVDRIARRFDAGLLHEVREGGAGLSAGERQLISIARALLADPRILILDEATSNIDRPTEILIEQALDRLLRGRTSIIIAHRLATVRRADEILVIEHGRITQRGRFDDLLAGDGPWPFALELKGSEAQLHGSAEPVDRQPREQLGERRRAPSPSSATTKSSSIAAQVRDAGDRAASARPSSVSFAYETRASEAQVSLHDVAGALEPLEEARDPGRGQQRRVSARSTRRILPPSACDRCSRTS